MATLEDVRLSYESNLPSLAGATEWLNGEGRYGESERVIQALLDEPGGLVEVDAAGVEAGADWIALASPETYLGYERAERFASSDLLALAEPHPYTTPSRLRLNPWAPHTYTMPSRLRLNHWALSGDWTIGRKAVRSDVAGGRLSFRFRARDVNLVMGPAEGRESIGFPVRLDGDPPGEARNRRRRSRPGRCCRPAPLSARPPARRRGRAHL